MVVGLGMVVEEWKDVEESVWLVVEVESGKGDVHLGGNVLVVGVERVHL